PPPPAPVADPINISGMDFRFNPLTGEAEAVSGNGQFGLTFDDWGNRFICSNRNPCMHVVIENRYLQRAPNVAIPAVVQDVAAAGENSRIFPLTRAWTTSNLHAGQFTAACGVFIYCGNLLPQLRGNVFTCDPTGNLIHREVMKEKGPTFESKPAYDGKEFLASRDEWFRPVSMQLGPDGALYVVDMYRAVIEHPEWVPDELKNRPDERFGDDRGRIYRIVPKSAAASDTNPKRQRGPFPKLSTLPSTDLVKLLAHDNAWQRDTAQRLLIERQEKGVAELLANAVADNSLPRQQVHGLWTLIGLQSPVTQFDKVITAENRHVRQNALTVTELLTAADDDDLRRNVADRISSDDEPAVRLRAALVPIRHESPEVTKSLCAALERTAGDPWMRRLFILTAPNAPDAVRTLADELLTAGRFNPLLLQDVIDANVALSGADWGEKYLERLLPSVGGSSKSRIALLTLARALEKRRMTLSQVASKLPGGDLRLKQATIDTIGAMHGNLGPTSNRLEIIELLGHLPETLGLLMEYSVVEGHPEYRKTAIVALGRFDSLDPWRPFLKRFPRETLEIRSAILAGILQRPDRIALLLYAMDAGSIKPAELDRVQTDRLLKHADAKIRERATKIFGSALPADRKKALEDYQSVLAMSADATRGKQVFAKNCATCHKIGEIGVNVAPDISDSRTKTPQQILGDIIQPNRAIDANYIAWNVLLTDGSAASGVLSAETGTSITLRQPEGKTLVVSRSDIDQLKSSGLSLMPEGLEKNIPHQEMADLVAFIKNWRYLDGRTPLGKP
ncbi:MAG: PVC-type heme-binding CxxCH protein, partial [Pirellulaceae bacterium]